MVGGAGDLGFYCFYLVTFLNLPLLIFLPVAASPSPHLQPPSKISEPFKDSGINQVKFSLFLIACLASLSDSTCPFTFYPQKFCCHPLFPSPLSCGFMHFESISRGSQITCL